MEHPGTNQTVQAVGLQLQQQFEQMVVTLNKMVASANVPTDAKTAATAALGYLATTDVSGNAKSKLIAINTAIAATIAGGDQGPVNRPV